MGSWREGTAGVATWATSVLVVACHADAPATAPSDWRPAAGVAAAACDDGEPLADPKADLGELRVACAQHLTAACSALGERGPLSTADLALVRRELAPRCARDPRCGCARFGHALLASPDSQVEAATMLDASCHRGALDACDDMLLEAELCAANASTHDSPLCRRLAAQGRLPKPELPPPPPRALPPTLARCFVVLSTARDRERCADPEPTSWMRPQTLGPTLAPGTVICFERDRWSLRPIMGRWNQRLAEWAVHPERDEAEDRTSGLVIETDGAQASASSNCEIASLTLANDTWIQDARRMPRVEEVCGRMRRCVAAVARAFPPPPDAASDAPPAELPDDVLGCAAWQAQATKLVPQPPPECE